MQIVTARGHYAEDDVFKIACSRCHEFCHTACPDSESSGVNTMKKEIQREEELMQLHQDRCCQAIVKFLVWGLMSRRPPVREICNATLISLGPNVADRMNELLDTGNLSDTHRKRVKAALSSATAAEAASPDASAKLMSSILSVIQHDDAQLLGKALGVGRYLHRRSLNNFIIDEAVNHVSDSRYFSRLLRAIEMSGERPSPSQMRRLVGLYHSESGSIGRSCGRLLQKISRGELDQQLCPGGFQQYHVTSEEMSQWPTTFTPIELFPEVSDPMWRKGFHYLPDLALSKNR